MLELFAWEFQSGVFPDKMYLCIVKGIWRALESYNKLEYRYGDSSVSKNAIDCVRAALFGRDTLIKPEGKNKWPEGNVSDRRLPRRSLMRWRQISQCLLHSHGHRRTRSFIFINENGATSRIYHWQENTENYVMLIGGRETVGRWKKCRELAFLNNVSRRWIQFNYLGIAMTSSAENRIIL